MVPGLTWQQKLDALAQWLREPDLFSGDEGLNAESNTPYFDPKIIEQWLYWQHLVRLRRISIDELQAVGSAAITTISAVPDGDKPREALRIISVQIQPTGSLRFVPATFVEPPEYFKQQYVAEEVGRIYSIYEGKWKAQGDSLSIRLLTEPTLSIFQADMPVLPARFDEEIMDETRKLLMVYDFMPGGRL